MTDRLAEIETGLRKHGKSWEDAGYFLTAIGEFGPGSNVEWLIAEVKRLRNALADAIELAEEGWAYDCVGYFRQKWDVDARLEALKRDQRTQEQD